MSFASARTIGSDLFLAVAQKPGLAPGFLFAVIYPITRTGLPSSHAAMSSTMSP
jgi:hypothetical protein